MIDYSSVYAAIKKYCLEEDHNPKADCFSIIADDAHVPLNYLEYVLRNLQDKGLIVYSFDDRVIYLTAKGKKMEKLFGD
jgi:hypothetical protein